MRNSIKNTKWSEIEGKNHLELKITRQNYDNILFLLKQYLFKYDWVMAIVIDDWTNCEKIIKHLKNQKNICFKVLMA